MAQTLRGSPAVVSEETREGRLSESSSVARRQEGLTSGFLRRFGEGALRAVFWTYRRGGWQYDIQVAVILAFIFLTPRSWLGDQPTAAVRPAPGNSGVVHVLTADGVALYHVDAQLLDSAEPRETSSSLMRVLERRLSTPFQLKSFAPVKNAQEVVVGYDVLVESAGD